MTVFFRAEVDGNMYNRLYKIDTQLLILTLTFKLPVNVSINDEQYLVSLGNPSLDIQDDEDPYIELNIGFDSSFDSKKLRNDIDQDDDWTKE